MYVLGKKWQNGYLDYHKHPDEARVNVRVWAVLEVIEDQYFVRRKDWRIVSNYLRKIGPRAVLNKIRSRRSEAGRNDKSISVGIGDVSEAAQSGQYSVGRQVVFLASNHPRCVDKLVLEEKFLLAWPYVPLPHYDESIRFYKAGTLLAPAELLAFAGWSRFSGLSLDEGALRNALLRVAETLKGILNTGKDPTLKLEVEPKRRIREQTSVPAPYETKLVLMSGVLFGLGNYAKTIILPYLNRGIRIKKIQEVDPVQTGLVNKWQCLLDSSELPRLDEVYDAYFIAGFHHTHTRLALHALSQGAYAVVEKPISTTRAQIESLKTALEPASSKLFACFHKRYSPFNNWAWEDLGVRDGQAITYHCLVYEVPLPQRHWYRWPMSGTRIMSNGCHWIDHFMFLNGYAEAKSYYVREAKNGDLQILIELINGAVFSMVMTDIGSERLGVRDHIELRANNVTVCMTDGSRYKAENTSRILRRRKVNPISSYKRMYSAISSKIVAGEAGDIFESVRSSELVISLEEQLQADRASRSANTVQRHP